VLRPKQDRSSSVDFACRIMGKRHESHPDDKARGGEIGLQTHARRAGFLAGLIGVVLLVVILPLFK